MHHAVTRDFLSFTLGGLGYGLDVAKVHELCMLGAMERFASGAGGVVEGVAVSRGVIMPIVDMRAAFAAGPVTPEPRSHVIILKLSRCVMGMVVDSVDGVVALRPEQIAPVPCADGATPADYLLGVGLDGERRLILVDIDCLMSIDKPKAARYVA